MNLSFTKYILMLFLGFSSMNLFSQVVLFEETFEDPNSVNTNWNLNTVNFWVGSDTIGDNIWVVNDVYLGINIPGIGVIPDTDSQFPPIVNNPNSSYLHTVSDSLFQSPGVQNTHYTDFLLTNSFETISSEMSFGVSTLGLTDVTVEFWWLCGTEGPFTFGFGGGQLFYSDNGGLAWNPVFPTNLTTSTWTFESLTNPAFDNVADLRFMFTFTNDLGAVDPVGFAVDDFRITTPAGPCFVDFGPDTTLCSGESVTYDFSSITNSNFLWSDGSTAAQNTFTQAGTYWLQVSDTIFGCTAADTVVISENPQINVSIVNLFQPSSCGANDGSFEVNAIGGTPPYNYSFDQGQNFIPVNNIIGFAGSYYVIVEDALGCQFDYGVVSLSDPSAVVINNELVNNMNCIANGDIEILATGSGSPLSYSIDGGQTYSANNVFNNLGEGTYTIEVTEGLCVTSGGTYTFSDPKITIDSIVTTDVECNTGNTGQIEVYASGGNIGVYNFSVDGGTSFSPTNTFSSLNAGSYTVIADDGVCQDTVSVVISQPGSLDSEAYVLGGLNGVGISCSGDSTGILYVLAIGGTGPYSYDWFDSSMNSINATDEDTVFNVGAGTYFVQVTDNNGCTSIDDVTILENDLLESFIISDSVSCFGFDDGTATVYVSGGVPPYTYQWSNGDDTQTASNLTAGTVWVLVQDVYGCDLLDTAFVEEPFLLEVNAIANDVTCHNYDDGELTAVPLNGTPPYTYEWTYPGYGVVGTTQTLSAMQPSTHSNYSVMVTDSNGCTATDSAWIYEPDPLVVSETQNTLPAYCVGLDYGSNTGFATVQATGGNPDINGNYNFVWAAESNLSFPGLWDSFLDNQSVISGVNPGYYTVVSTDYKGCVDTTKVSIPLVETMDVIITSEDNNCFQGSDGVATAFGFGGCGQFDPFDCDYVFEWTTPSSVLTFYGEDAAITDLAEGTYAVTVTDTNGCSITESVYIDEPDEIVFSMIATDQSCYGDVASNDGSIFVDIQGGLQPSYTLEWYEYVGVFPGTSLGTQLVNDNYTIDNLASGEYNVEVYDANGCVGVVDFSSQETNPVEIEQGYQVQVEIDTDPSVLDLIIDCYNIDNGEAQVLSPDQNLSYVWSLNSNPIDTGASTQSLSDGNVTVTAYYGNWLCETVSLPVTLQDPPQIAIDPAVTITPESCVNADNGSISFPNLYNDISGGIPFGGAFPNPYILNWDPSTAADPGIFNLQNLSPGVYTLSVGDANGCVYPIEFEIDPAVPLAVTITNPNENNYNGYWVDCNGANTGSAEAIPTGGNPGYGFNWSNMVLGPLNTNLTAGVYTVTVTDANGCSETASVELTEPQAVELINTSTVNISCKDANDGVATLSPFGGVPNYSIESITNVLPEALVDFTNLAPGSSSYTLTDANGCQTSINVNITEPTELLLNVFTSMYGSFEISCFGENDGVITASAQGGTTDANGNYDFTLSGSSNNFLQGSSSVDFSSLTIGTYDVLVTDANGCSETITGTLLSQPDEISVAFTTNYSVAQPTPFTLDFQDLSQPTLSNATTPASAVVTSWFVDGVNEQFGFGNFDNTQAYTFYSMGEHEVTLVATNNNNLCSDELTQYFLAQGLSENNVFSPNGDNLNDEFSFENYGMSEMNVTIYNRWGEKVYEMFSPDSSWDGVSLSGKEVPEGVYFYVLNAMGVDGSNYEEKGSVTIYR